MMKRYRRGVSACHGLMALAGLVISIVGTPGSAVAAAPVLYGEWNPGWQSGDGVDNALLTNREADLGHHLNLVHWYAAKNESYGYDGQMVDGALAQGRTPMVSWNI